MKMMKSHILEPKTFIDESSENDKVNMETPLQKFYNDQCIFITGGTGFIGKILIEKLLRCCPDISRIYILVRPKRDINIIDRIDTLLESSVFDRLRKEMPKFSKKIIGISGDCGLPELGISTHDSDLLIQEVSIVFHVAATVRFDEKLTKAVTVNLQSTGSILNICKRMSKLKVLIHVSTAYTNVFSSKIEEKFYDYYVRSEELLKFIKVLPEDDLNEITPKLIKSWPNTYTFTKALAEDLIRTNNDNMPIGIFRPGIVISTAKEPTPGWIDNYYGPTGVVASTMTGLMRAQQCDLEKIANIVPADLTINALIVSAWDVATQVDKRDENMLIYNFISTEEAPISWGTFSEYMATFTNKYPTKNALWYFVFLVNKYTFIYWMYIFFLHWIPAILIDFLALCIGRNLGLWRVYKKIHKFSHVLAYFATREWKFTNNNVRNMWQRLDPQDKHIFPFSMRNFDWFTFFDSYVKGVRIYLLNDNLKTLEESKIRWQWLYWMHQVLKIVSKFLVCWFLWKVLSTIYKLYFSKYL